MPRNYVRLLVVPMTRSLNKLVVKRGANSLSIFVNLNTHPIVYCSKQNRSNKVCGMNWMEERNGDVKEMLDARTLCCHFLHQPTTPCTGQRAS